MSFYNEKDEYKEWCNQECDEGLKNIDFINSFLDKYVKWIKKQKTVVGIETRELQMKDYLSLHKEKIRKIIYNMSI
tara:strand:- start:10649 stop:10876 length:228 start_codon:yes stop_codon:yes gene_type:complete